MIEAAQLPPCPGCRGEPRISSFADWYRVYCPRCGVGGGDWVRDVAVRRWIERVEEMRRWRAVVEDAGRARGC